MTNERDLYYMHHAIKLARKAEQHGEVPVGAVLVLNDTIIGEGWNQPISTNDPTAHAEIVALRSAAQQVKNYRLLNTTLYVTLEPCLMCVGAMIHARIQRLVYGADDPKTGAIKSVFTIPSQNVLNHSLECHSGVLAHECGELLKDFFKKRR
ncbi:MAG: tRNA adenosine(34) deaminase TadA [Proteobacteria bacterium]|nr:tRNA adenosine(34) deaminase TadA [Pseudomonadota bacterium]